MAKKTNKSVIEFLAYQRKSFRCKARVHVDIWCRQAGKDFTSAAVADDSALMAKQPWFIISVGQRQADATFEKAKTIAAAMQKAYGAACGFTEEDPSPFRDYDPGIDQLYDCTARTLRFKEGGFITALPGRNPDVLAGLTGNIILTEFALFPNGGYNHWKVLFPLITRGYRIRVITTPRGRNTKAYELASDTGTYSVLTVPIQQAVKDGLVLRDNNGKKTTIEAFKRLYNDPAGWAREYECQWSGDLQALVSWAMLVAAGQRGSSKPFDLIRVDGDAGYVPGRITAMLKKLKGRLELGWDVARNGHISSLWVNHAPDRKGPRHLRLLVLMEHATFALQRQIAREVMRAIPGNVGCGDSTGLGMESNEALAAEFPGRWEGVNFTGISKRELASGLLSAYDDGTQSIPPTDGPAKMIATDIYAIQREGDRETVKISESDNPLLPQSHCDIGMSNGLALRASRLNSRVPTVSVIGDDDYGWTNVA